MHSLRFHRLINRILTAPDKKACLHCIFIFSSEEQVNKSAGQLVLVIMNKIVYTSFHEISTI